MHVRSPRRRGDPDLFPGARYPETELLQDESHLGHEQRQPGETFHLRPRKLDHRRRCRDLAGDLQLGWRAAAQVEDQFRREFGTRDAERRIDAALEAVSRVAVDAELAARQRDVERVPERALDEDVGRPLVASGAFSAHDAGDGLDAGIIGDHHHAVVERVGPAVERQDLFPVLRPAHDEMPRHLGGVEDVQRPAAVERDVIGDVDERVDRSETDRLEPPLHPVGRRAVPDATHQPQRESRTQVAVVVGEVQRDLHRARPFAPDALGVEVAERAEAGSCEVAGNAMHARRIGAVRGQVDLDDRIADPGIVDIGHADGRVRQQVDDAVVIVGKLQFRRGAEHTVRLDTADRAFADRDVLARNECARRREDRFHSRPRSGRAADDLHRDPVAGIDHADAQLVGVGVLLCRDHVGDRERGQRLGGIVDRLDLEPDPRQRLDDRVQRRRGVEVVPQPGEREFHGVSIRFSPVT